MRKRAEITKAIAAYHIFCTFDPRAGGFYLPGPMGKGGEGGEGSGGRGAGTPGVQRGDADAITLFRAAGGIWSGIFPT